MNPPALKHAGTSKWAGVRGIRQEWEGARSLIGCRTDPQKRFRGPVSFWDSIKLDLASVPGEVEVQSSSQEGQQDTEPVLPKL